ncbi:exopolysaccharide biosynthesis polyprenyl glycosylphosphotransferase [Verrucomicrobiota bacterium]
MNKQSFAFRQIINSSAVGLSDALMLYLSIYVGDVVLYFLHDIPIKQEPALLLIPAWLLLAYLVRLLPGWGWSVPEILRRLVISLSGLFVVVILAQFLTDMQRSRITLVSGYFCALVLVPLGRVVIKSWLIKRKLWGAPAVIYGGQECVVKLNQILKTEKALGYVPVAAFSDDPINPAECSLPVRGGLHDKCNESPVAIVSLKGGSRGTMVQLLEELLAHYRIVVFVPDLFDAPSMWVKPRDLQGTLGLEVAHNLLDPVPRLIKRAFELVLVLGSAVFWAPLIGVLALMVWLSDRGNPFFLQERIGRRGKPFKTYKLRTMVPNAEQVLQEALEKDPELKAEWDATCKLKKDPRITWVGNFLRVTSLDELPQLINVLKGDMAIVGPRPLPRYHYDQLPEYVQRLRERVLPGITGMWQVSGRSDSGNEGFEKWDSYYVRNWSIWLDAYIIFRTVSVVLMREGAY